MKPNAERWRDEFPVAQKVVYLNTGASGPCPVSVAEQLWQRTKAFELDAEIGWESALQGMETARADLARLLGADPDEIAFTRNATEAVNIAANGVRWSEGDEILLSSEEHAAMLYPWTYAAQRQNLVLKQFSIDPDPKKTLQNMQSALTPQTRLMAASHVSCVTGIRNPAARMSKVCRKQGVLSLIDGAQAAGQFCVRNAVQNADFYAGNGHKWLHGPKGTGFLRVRKSLLRDLDAHQVGVGAGTIDPNGRFAPDPTARRFECGTLDYGKYAAFTPLLQWWDRIGFENARARMRRLTRRLKRRLLELSQEISGEKREIRLHTPLQWKRSSAMTSFSVRGVPAKPLAERLYQQWNIRTRVVEEIDGLRVSTALFNSAEEIDLLINALRETLRETL